MPGLVIHLGVALCVVIFAGVLVAKKHVRRAASVSQRRDAKPPR